MKRELDQKSHEWTRHERVIVFDGVCNWCNAWVNFTIDHDPHGKFKFGMLQSEHAQQILQDLQLSTENFETFLLLEHARAFYQILGCPEDCETLIWFLANILSLHCGSTPPS